MWRSGLVQLVRVGPGRVPLHCGSGWQSGRQGKVLSVHAIDGTITDCIRRESMSESIEYPCAAVSADRLPELPISFAAPAIVRIAAATAIAVGTLVLVGWTFDLQPLKSVLPGLVSMKANTALAFLLAGVSIAAWTIQKRGRTVTTILRIAATGIVLIGGATLAEYLVDCNFGIDQFIFADRELSDTSHPGRAAPATAANFVLLGAALLLLPFERLFARRLTESLALAVCLVAAVALIGYLYGTQSLYKISSYTSMALHTAATFAIAGGGLLFARADFVLVAPFRSPGPGGVVARRLIPAILTLPLILGWLRLQGQYLDFFDLEFGLSLFALSNIAIFLCLVWWVSRLSDVRETTHRAAEIRGKEVLRASEERLRLAQQVAAIGTSELNLQTGVNTWTPELEAMYGLSRGEFGRTQRDWEQWVHEDDRPLAIATVEKAFDSFEPEEAEWRVKWPDGSIHWLAGRFQVFNGWDGKPLRLVGINIDVTARKATERALRESEARAGEAQAMHRAELAHVLRLNTMGEMATGLAHEINQPLSAIYNYAHGAIRRLRDESCDPPELIEVAKLIAEESARASAIIQSLKRFVQKGVFERKPIDINALVRTAIRIIAVEAERHSTELSVQYALNSPCVRGDSIQLEQVVINLMLNGIEAMDTCKRARFLQVRIEILGADVVVAVIDGGLGLPGDNIERIFDTFFTTKPNGLGMGLSISRSIVEAHEGKLWAEANPAGGAIFRLALPIDQESSHEA